jgi:hypothetical protein
MLLHHSKQYRVSNDRHTSHTLRTASYQLGCIHQPVCKSHADATLSEQQHVPHVMMLWPKGSARCALSPSMGCSRVTSACTAKPTNATCHAYRLSVSCCRMPCWRQHQPQRQRHAQHTCTCNLCEARGTRTMARRPFLISRSCIASLFWPSGSKGKLSSTPDCRA